MERDAWTGILDALTRLKQAERETQTSGDDMQE